MIGLVALLGLLAMPAARVDDHALTLQEIDAATGGRAEALQTSLREVAEEAAWVLVDERLGIEVAGARPVTDADVAKRRAKTAGLLPPETNDRALRWQIERERREAARERASEAARGAAGARLDLPSGRRLATALPPGRPIAWVADEPIAAEELERRAAIRLYRLRGELHRERMRRLEEAIDRRLLAVEAERLGTSVEELVRAAPVSEAEVRHYVAMQAGARGVAPDPARVRPLLESRARHRGRAKLLARLRAEADVEILLAPPPVPRVDGDDASAPRLGESGAPPERTIVVFGDYRSRASRRVHREIDRVRSVRPDVKVVVRDFIPGFDPVAEEAARAGRCAQRAGVFADWRMEILNRKPPSIGEPWYDGEARRLLEARLGMAPHTFADCAADATIGADIARDTAAAEALGFAHPPALVVAGRPMSGVQSADTITAALDPGRSSPSR